MKRRALYFAPFTCLILQFAPGVDAQQRIGPPERPVDSFITGERVMLLTEFEEVFRQAGAQARISPEMQEDLLALFRANNTRRLIRTPELHASLLELLYKKDIPYPVAKNFLLNLRDNMKPPAPVDTGFLEAAREVNIEDRVIHKIGKETGITAPRPVKQPLPLYTETARNLGIEGLVILKAHVLEDGSIANVKVVRSLGYGLDESAILTLQEKWKFQPGMLEGKPVPVEATIEMSFRLY